MKKQNVTEVVKTLASSLIQICETKEAAEAEAWWLLEGATESNRAKLLQEKEFSLTPAEETTLNKWLKERVEQKKPIQYILGLVPFCDLQIFVEPPILIPRPETEEWCTWLIEKLKPINKPLKILDIGCGSGCIALSLAKAFPDSKIIGVDIHPGAIELSKKNGAVNKINNATFIQSDLYDALQAHKFSFDLIVSNPPYISESEYKKLSEEVTKWEDKTALVAEDNGFGIHKKILFMLKEFLNHESVLLDKKLFQVLIEFGKGQEATIKELFLKTGLHNIEIHRDMEGVYRWITGSLKR